MLVFFTAGRDRRYSGGQGLPGSRQRTTRSARDLLHSDDMETVMADALVR